MGLGMKRFVGVIVVQVKGKEQGGQGGALWLWCRPNKVP